MGDLTVVIPNYNGIAFIEACLDSLMAQTAKDFEILVVDNGSDDGSRELVEEKFPQIRMLALAENTGFCRAVNEGIRASAGEYVLLLNNDTVAEKDFVEEMLAGIRRHPGAFSCGAKMINLYEPEIMDGGGDFYNALGWAYARGKGKSIHRYDKEVEIFSSCGGAAIYRRRILDEIGLFDEAHFAYLEDMDLGFRAKIRGYENWFLPKALVRHAGSGTSGSRYNLFKVTYSSRNNIYLIYKNIPILQILLNLPFFLLGFGIKWLFFASKGFGREYAAGIKSGFALVEEGKKRGRKMKFSWKYLGNYSKIQLALWWNIPARFFS